ncbi:hypothetical protein SAMN06265378_1094 [Paracoccus sediminis]|uniref:Uncharacterized protein n=1 Tax=Paracoccus sediminis TaxID=1214787 RepID=A0A238XB51_9RHOB|nr:hypothetical protein SAMN06265378_1094 [Paracoccus sediminis]
MGRKSMPSTFHRQDVLSAPPADRPVILDPLAQADRRRRRGVAADQDHRGRPSRGRRHRQKPEAGGCRYNRMRGLPRGWPPRSGAMPMPGSSSACARPCASSRAMLAGCATTSRTFPKVRCTRRCWRRFGWSATCLTKHRRARTSFTPCMSPRSTASPRTSPASVTGSAPRSVSLPPSTAALLSAPAAFLATLMTAIPWRQHGSGLAFSLTRFRVWLWSTAAIVATA